MEAVSSVEELQAEPDLGSVGLKRKESQAEMQDLGLGNQHPPIPNDEPIGSAERKDVGWKLVEGSVLE